MKKIVYLLVVLNMAIETQAQSAIAGEYYLRGVMETISGFLLMAGNLISPFSLLIASSWASANASLACTYLTS